MPALRGDRPRAVRSGAGRDEKTGGDIVMKITASITALCLLAAALVLTGCGAGQPMQPAQPPAVQEPIAVQEPAEQEPVQTAGAERPADTEEPADAQTEPAPEGGAAITFVNNAEEEADIWLLPDTEANRKTSLWGTATIKDLETEGERQVSLDALGGPGTYLFRAIDDDDDYYEAGGIALEDGYTVLLRVVREDGYYRGTVLEVTDGGGAPVETFDVFHAAL